MGVGYGLLDIVDHSGIEYSNNQPTLPQKDLVYVRGEKLLCMLAITYCS
jgi:hypothetical protein